MNIDQILQSRYKRVNNYSYKLMGNQFGLDAAFSDSDLDINESEMSVVVPFADGNRRDGVGDLLEIGGIRTERHINNPIILFDHGKSVQLPIGLAEDPNTGEYTVELDLNKQKAYCKAFFYQGKTALGIDDAGKAYDHSVFCEQLFDLLSKKYIRAGSIGYQVIQAKELPANYETGSPKGLHLLSTLMLEASVVVLPANQDTVRKALCLSSVCGKPLSPILVKSLAPYAPNRKVQVGFSGTVPIPHGSEINTTNVPPVSWKPGVGAKIKFIKDISDIRLKYKKTYKLRRRLKKSAMGSSVIYVKKSDIDKIKEEAEKANVQLQLKGSTGGYEKVKLMGNDNFIDDIAKKYGRIIKSRKLVHNKKSLPNEGENMEDDLDLEEGYAPEEENDSDEPYGASVLRRIHEDHKILMEDYDKLLKPLENEGVRSHLQQILEHIEEILSLTEDLFTNTENYKDLKPLENKEEPEGMSQTPDEEEGDEDEDEEVEPSEESVEAVPADSESVDEPTPEEAIEGMKREKKNMMIKKQKGMCPACKKANCKCSPKCNSKNLKKKDEDMKEKGMEEENMEEKGMEEENMEEKGMEEENMEEKSQKPDIPSPDEEDEEKEEKQNEESIKQNYSKALQSYEKEMAQEGHSYLKELTDAQDYNDEHRMKSYHFHKVLGKIGGVEDEKCNKYYGMKKFVGDRNWMQEEAKEEEHELHPHRKMCGDASSYFKALSTERAFGDAHRAEADYHAKNMDAIFGENQEQKGTDVDENSSNEVENGSMGEMGETKKLKNLILRQNKELEELSRKLQNLSI